MTAGRAFRFTIIALVRHAGGRPWIVLALAAVLTIASVWVFATRLAVNSDTADMLSRDLPFRQRAQELKAAFPDLDDTLLVVVEGPVPELVAEATDRLAQAMTDAPVFDAVFYPAGHPFFRVNGLLYQDLDAVEDLAGRLARAQPFLGPLARDPSLRGLADLLDTIATEADAIPPELDDDLGTMLTRMAETVEGRLDGQATPLSWQTLLATDNGTAPSRHLIVARPAVDYRGLAPGKEAIRVVRALADDLVAPRGGRVRLTGPVALAFDELRSVRDGITLAGSLSLALVIGLLWWGLHSLRLLAATVVTLLMGLTWTGAFAVLAVGMLNLISVAFAVLFIGLSVDFGIHFTLRYREARSHGAPHTAALTEAAGDVGGALACSALAAALGFLSFLPTAYQGLAELGLISGVGMGIALLANLTVLPALLTLLHPRGTTVPVGVTPRLGVAVEHHARPILAVATVLGLGAALLAPQARFDFDPLNLKSPRSESMQTLTTLIDSGLIEFHAAQALAPDLEAARALAARLDLPEVGETRTLADLIPARQEAKLAVIADLMLILGPSLMLPPRPPPARDTLTGEAARLATLLRTAAGTLPEVPAERLATALDRAAAQGAGTVAAVQRDLTRTLPLLVDKLSSALEAAPVAHADLPAALRTRWQAWDGRARIEITPAEALHTSPTDHDALARFVAAVRSVVPDATGTPVVIVEAGRTILAALAQAAALSVGLIALALAMVLRSLRGVLYVFAPLVLAAALTVGASVVLGIAFNFANVIVLPLIFGLGVAGGIHIVQRVRRTGQVDTMLATSTPRAVVFSSLTTIGSFASLSLSAHPGTASMGVLLTVAVGLTLLSVLVVLPALMAVAPLGPLVKR